MTVIHLDRLTKRFGDVTAVDAISFDIAEGEIFGFLGPNGAGKTTTLMMLVTLLDPTDGEATVNGYDISTQKDEVRQSIGIVFQDESLDEELTAAENMDFHGRLYGVPKSDRGKRIDDLLDLVGLSQRRDDLVKTFSGGMRRRLEIARGLLHAPKVLFLDEPTLGLDPQTRNHVWDYIDKLRREQNVTVIITTHYMDEADKLADRIAIIDHGEIIALDTSENLKSIVGGGVISIRSEQNDRVSQRLNDLDWVASLNRHNGRVDLSADNVGERVAEVIQVLDRSDIDVQSVTVHTPTLEDVFLHYTGRTIRDEDASGRDRMRQANRMGRR
ncbi:MAG: ATP-binding cassette domain-containing protein [Candidatus Bipolaricaulia bacterium]